MKSRLKYMSRNEIDEAIKNAKKYVCSSFKTRYISEYLDDNGQTMCTRCLTWKPRKEMWYNPKTGDIKCNECFVEYCKPFPFKKNILAFAYKKLIGNIYPSDMQDYYQGNSNIKIVIT